MLSVDTPPDIAMFRLAGLRQAARREARRLEAAAGSRSEYYAAPAPAPVAAGPVRRLALTRVPSLPLPPPAQGARTANHAPVTGAPRERQLDALF
ncbi:hypothetical protein [Palleronia pelagia]|uniref:Uncharacterized protein n=1 Tax=Palleronia pelagia TaxID=387096 RepID=A0A1H8JZQ7_9RHOB|nr:hypothetical protein [Palleronia pelagia]SEN86254.1 hypothetical protein SAMN04488011_10732 [Palleronia pelagia]